MKTFFKKQTIILLILAMIMSVTPTVFAGGDAANQEELKTLINAEAVYPQITGYIELDNCLESIFAPYEDSDTYTKLKFAYDWCVREIDFNWAPYSQNYAPAYDKFNVDTYLTYDTSLEEVIPWDTANRCYYALTNHKGVCYDYASVFAVMARYIGIDSYVHTGPFVFEKGYGTGSGHHGWTELILDGNPYIFDPQRDYRMSADGRGTIPYNYFGVPYVNAWRYTQETELNAQRDSKFKSVKEPRAKYVNVAVSSSPSGTVTGGGTYEYESAVTVTADSDNAEFVGWYDLDGNLVSEDKTYTFTATENVQLRAVFNGEYFEDVNRGDWFYADVTKSYELGAVNGIGAFTFAPYSEVSRAMALNMLAGATGVWGDKTSTPYEDVASETWYTAAVYWAKENGLLKDIVTTQFMPDKNISREEFVTILVRYIESTGFELKSEELKYTDIADITPYALEYIAKAQSVGLIAGYEDGTFNPQGSLTRAEGTTIIMRMLGALEK